jgi:hypothetical protein
MDNDSQKTTTSIALIAVVAALALLGVVVVVIVVTIPQQVEARGCIGNNVNGIAFNASKGRCFHP